VTPPAPPLRHRTGARAARASVVLLGTLAYLASVFQIFQRPFWTAGLGDWMDPYFINALLEHWYQSAARLADPSSPPMYFPAQNTLGYSHGLVLYGLAYVPFRLLFHPFQAYSLMLLSIMAAGIVCLYLLLRRHLRLTFVEAVLLTAFFTSSENVINGETGVWAQRASVFLIPPILLMLAESARMPDGSARMAMAFLGGLCALLLYTQDFYTAHFAFFFAALVVAVLALERRRAVLDALVRFWRTGGPAPRIVLVVMALTGAWALLVGMHGGGAVSLLGLTIRSHNWRRPAAIAVASLAAFLVLRKDLRRATLFSLARPWLGAAMLGAAAGAALFLWIYLPTYLEQRGFPEEHLLNALLPRSPSRWNNPLDFFSDLNAYSTTRTFVAVLVLTILAWMPWFRVDRKARLYGLGLLAVSMVVLVVPIRFDGFSVWRTFLEPLPGFRAIRDPKRMVYLYELAAVLAMAAILSRVRAGSAFRIAATAAILFLLIADRERVAFDYKRPNDVFRRWPGAPIAIDRSCRSFFITRASAEYSARSDHKWTLYSIDALFVALSHGVPTLNGYSAWYPREWRMLDPEVDDYMEHVHQWIEVNTLTGVCELDIERHTMNPVGGYARP
jgi:hypothetical protein